MKKYLFTVLIALLIVGFGFAGVVFAQDEPFTASERHMIREQSNLSYDYEFEMVCSGEIIHPVLMNLAEIYEVDYEELLAYFCDFEFGVGEIRLALVTAEREGVDLTYDEVLTLRLIDGEKEVGWGLIWQELGLIGRGRNSDETENLNDDHENGAMCTGEMVHPALKSLADRYDVAYDDLLVYFCEQQFGVGEIMLALRTAEREDVDLSYQDILDMRHGDGMKEVGWGLIWQELGLIGRGGNNDETEMGPPEEKGPPEERNNNKPAIPPGLGGAHPGKGIGPKK
jgi:hypothetical protein